MHALQVILYVQLRFIACVRPDDRGPPLVLVPGCGLARLCVEIAGLGFETHGNEFSYFMLLPSSFMLNHSTGAKTTEVHPWVLSTSNQLSDEDQLRSVKIPDKDPADIVTGPGLLSMVAGDFIVSAVHQLTSQQFRASKNLFLSRVILRKSWLGSNWTLLWRQSMLGDTHAASEDESAAHHMLIATALVGYL